MHFTNFSKNMKWNKIEANDVPSEEVLAIGFQDELLVGYINGFDEYFCESENEILKGVYGYILISELKNLEFNQNYS